MFQLLKKIFFQPVRAFETTQPISYQLNSDFKAQLIGIKPFSSLLYLKPKWRNRVTHLDVNERIIELPFVFNQLDFHHKGKVLDLGCCESLISINLATAGFEVTGMDIRPYLLKHPNFHFIQADICQTKIKTKFDYILSISTLEHIGLNTIYGPSSQSTDDQNAINQIYQLLKPKGKLILTVPASKHGWQNSFMRSYTDLQLKKMLKNFAKVQIEYFKPDKKRQFWSKTTANQLPSKPTFGVALIVATK